MVPDTTLTSPLSPKGPEFRERRPQTSYPPSQDPLPYPFSPQVRPSGGEGRGGPTYNEDPGRMEIGNETKR